MNQTRGKAPSRLHNRTIQTPEIRTSIRLEPELWVALEEMAQEQGKTVGEVVGEARKATPVGGRTSAVRVALVGWLRQRGPKAGATPKDVRRAIRALSRPAPQPDHEAARRVLQGSPREEDLVQLESYSCED